MSRKLLWQREKAGEAYLRFGQTQYDDHRWSNDHSHDFFECLWIDSGHLSHEINGQVFEMYGGDVMFQRPQDQHRFKGDALFTTVSIPASLHQAVEQRWSADCEVWPWQDPSICWQIGEQQRHELHRDLSRISLVDQRVVDAEWIIAHVLRIIIRQHNERSYHVPDWLQQAMNEFKNRNLYALGFPAFKELCPVSASHLSRTVRKNYNCTCTDLVNIIRLDQVAHQLRFSNANVLDIALDLGFSNQGHFHKLFKQRFAVTPLQFRKNR
ncbi:MAG: AraC family transcriptional regulator [Planctomycetes bacterium]|nr:AraC family transcriptional regulator [Planctomycetota bacterium]